MRSRCQRRRVSGRTSSRMLRSTSRGSRCSRAVSNARSAGVNRIFSPCSCRSRTLIWWRRARISASLARSLMDSSRSIANALVTPRYASRSSTAGHLRAATVGDSKRAGRLALARSLCRDQSARDQGGCGSRHPQGRRRLQRTKLAGQIGFQVLPRRWVAERTFAWINRCRRTVRDYERLPEHHAAMVHWSMVIIMTRRLARHRRTTHQQPPTRAA